MPKNLSVADIIEKNKLYSNTPFVILLDVEIIDPATGLVNQTIHLARNNEDVVYNSNTYVKSSFEFKFGAEAGETPNVSISITDYQNSIQGLLQEYGGGLGSHITVFVVNAGNLTQAPDNIEYFDVITATTSNYVVEWSLGAENILTHQFPKRKQFKDRCSWRYAGAECGYAGPLPSCDLSLDGPNGCQYHNNTPNFGGFPGINASNVRYA